MSEKQHLPTPADEAIAIHFNPSGKTQAFHGIKPSEFQKKQLAHDNILGYMLLAFDAFEIGAGIITGFSWDNYLMIGAATLASIGWFMPKDRRSNFFQIQQDKITFSRTEDETSLTATMILLRLAKPTILSAAASEIEQIDLMLDEVRIFFKDGKKTTMNLTNLDSKHTIQDILMDFCTQQNIQCQFSSLALNERKKQ